MEKTYKDYVVRVDDANMRFQVKSTDGESAVWFDSYSQAIAWIDKQAVKVRALARAKIALPAIRGDGQTVTLTGLHARSQDLLTKPAYDGSSYSTPNYYPHVAWISDRIKEIQALSKQLSDLQATLKPFAIDSHGVGRKARVNYEDGLDALKADHAAKMAAAEKEVA